MHAPRDASVIVIDFTSSGTQRVKIASEPFGAARKFAAGRTEKLLSHTYMHSALYIYVHPHVGVCVRGCTCTYGVCAMQGRGLAAAAHWLVGLQGVVSTLHACTPARECTFRNHVHPCVCVCVYREICHKGPIL